MMKKINLLLLGAAILAAAATVRAQTCTIPFEFRLVEPGPTPGSSVSGPGPGWITFSPLAKPFTPLGGFTPIWDSSLTSFPTAELDTNQMYGYESVWTLDGVGFMHFHVRADCTSGPQPCLVPGAYTLTADHGFEYNRQIATLVLFSDGSYQLDGVASAFLQVRLGHVVETPGYWAVDLHQHASDGEAMPPKARVLMNLALGLEVWAHSAHNRYRYYQETIDQLGLRDTIVSLPSDEITTIISPTALIKHNWPYWGHFNPIPQYAHLVNPAAYACDPFCNPALPGCQPYCPPADPEAHGEYLGVDLPWSDTTPFHFFYHVRLQESLAGHPVFFQVNHPWIEGAPGVLTAYYFDMLDDQGHVTTANLPYWRDDFDGMGYTWGATGLAGEKNYRYWYALLNQGYHYTMVRDSDGHTLDYPPRYYWTWVKMPVETIAEQPDRQALADALAQNLKQGHAVYGSFPYLHVLWGGTDAVGETIPVDSDTVTFQVQVQARMGTPITTVLAIVNGSTVGNWPVTPGVVNTPQGPRLELDQDFTLYLPSDSWVVFMTDTKASTANPIWVDRDGDGKVSPLFPRPEIAFLSLAPVPAWTGDTVTFTFRVTPAPTELPRAWIAAQPAACAVLSGDTFTCSYVVKGAGPEFEGPENEVRVTALGPSGYRGFAYTTIELRVDADGDGLLDNDELVLYGTDPSKPDTDGDNMPDGWEVKYSLNPLANDSAADADGDGLSNGQEYQYHTNPRSSNTDEDAMPDLWEVIHGTQPEIYDSDADPDQDGLVNSLEYSLNTEPLNPDTDGDLMPDGFEVAFGACLSVKIADGLQNGDTDGLENVHEYYNNGDGNLSDPCAASQPKRGQAGGGYFGDADGDLVIGVPDLNIINLKLNGRSVNYANVFPADPVVQDLDGDLVIGVPDKNLLSLILNGRGTDFVSGSPTQLELVEPVGAPALAPGETLRLQVKLTKEGAQARPGFGVVFTLVGGAGALFGGEGVSGPGRYDLTARDGVAQMVVRREGAGTLQVQVELPYDAGVHTRPVTMPLIQILENP